jgi:hypothetical protein
MRFRNRTVRTVTLTILLLLSVAACGSEPLFEGFDATWSERWWAFGYGGYTFTATQLSDRVHIAGKGPGYGAIQSRTAIMDRIRSLAGPTPSGLYLKLRGEEGASFTLQLEGNRRASVTLAAASDWTTVKVPFAEFSPPITFHELKTARFVQFDFSGRVNLDIAAIGWLYPKKYDRTRMTDLEVANFRTKPNLEYNPLLKTGPAGKNLRIVDRPGEGWLETTGGSAGDRQGFSFEVDGRFDEGGCPDWAQIDVVTLQIKATKRAPLGLEFFPPDGDKPVATAAFQADPEFKTVQVPVAGLKGGISRCAIFMPRDVDIQLKRVGVLAPEGMFLEEMERRGKKSIRHYRWRNSFLEMRGLDFRSLDNTLRRFEKSVQERQFAQYYDLKNSVDRFYWYGIQLLALRAMNRANLDRAEAIRDQPLIDRARDRGTQVSAIINSLKSDVALPPLQALFDDENELCAKTIAMMKQKDLRPSVKGRQFYSPSGKPIHYFGTHSFIATRKGMLFRPEKGFDPMCKRLAALGFNGIRFEAEECRFMPSENGVDANLARAYNEAIETAWKYGLWVEYDNHFYFPHWVCAGSKEFPNPKPASPTNSFQNLPGTLKVWEETARSVKDCKNIFVFETPSNEPFFYDPAGTSIRHIPAMMFEWNQFLKRKYQTRDRLAEAWTERVEFPELNRLWPEEDWDKNSILPPGFTPKDAEAKWTDAKNQNARIWDWLMFAAYLQGKTTGAISDAVRRHIPSASFMQQFIIGDEWDQNPIPFSYLAIVQSRREQGRSIFLGSHYGVAGRQALKAVALGTPSTDSENPGENLYGAYLMQKLYGCGATLFADYARWGGGMLWENDDCDFKESTAYVPLIADFFTTAEPLYTEPRPRVAVVEPTRLAGTRQNDFVDSVTAILDKAAVGFHLLEEHYVIGNPDVLKQYDIAIVNVTQANTALLDVLKHSRAKVFLFGCPFRDAFCRVWPAGILGWFTRNNTLIRSYSGPAAETDSTVNLLSLEGDVKFKYDKKNIARDEKWAEPGFDDAAWSTKPVPGYWGELDILGSRKYFIGDGWYRFHVDIPAAWKGKQITLRIGAIDDTDEVFINGKPFGSTTAATPNPDKAPRNYPVPNDFVKFGSSNVLAVKVANTFSDAGIYLSPVALAAPDAQACTMKESFGCLAKNEQLNIVVSREHFYPATSDLTASARVLAGFGHRAALVRDGNFFFAGPGLQEKTLLAFLKDAGLSVEYPISPQARLYPFTDHYYIVRGFPDASTLLKIKGTHYQPIGMEVLANAKIGGGFIEFTVPQSAICLIRVW